MKNRTFSLLLCISMAFVFVFGFGCTRATDANQQSSVNLSEEYLLLNSDTPSLNYFDKSVIVSEPGFASANEDRLLETFKNGHRIMFVDTTPEEVSRALHLSNQSVNHIDANDEYLGSMAYQCDNYDVVVGVYVEDTDDMDMVSRAIENAMEYDFGELMQTKSISDAWPEVSSHANTYTFSGFIVNAAMKLMLSPNNPTFSGQRSQVALYNVDIVNVNDSNLISTADFDIDVGNESIVDYSPSISHADADATISITYPWGIGVSFSTKTDVDVSLVSGGIAHKNITLRYTPTSILSIPIPTSDDICSRMSVESYSTNAGTAHSAVGTFTISYQDASDPFSGETVSRSMGVSGYDSQ